MTHRRTNAGERGDVYIMLTRLSERLAPPAGLLLLCFLLFAPAAGAHPPDAPPPAEDEPTDDETPQFEDSVEVRARADDLVGIASSAGEGATGHEDLERRPLLRPAELVETVPGMIATQHSGNGKANQYFLRGFNLDHGTDFSIWVDGVPVNMPSHGHGQGYADLNFLIPEMVDTVRYRKGPYSAERGDFSAAGGVDMQIIDVLPRPMTVVTGGSFDYGRALFAGTRELGASRVTAALDLSHNNGPWDRGEDYEGIKGLVHLHNGDGARGFSISAVGYDASWLSTDQIPRRAVDAGLIGEFGLIDASDQGGTARYSLSGEMHRGEEETLSRISGYLLYYDLNLFSNFTYFLDDPEGGDQFEQQDERVVAGFDVKRSWLGSWGNRAFETTAGLQVRADDIDNGLFRSQNAERTATVRADQIRQLTGGVYAESLVHWSDKIRPRLGLRADFYDADVDSDLSANSGSASDVLLSPKLSVAFGPWNKTELYLNAGTGFHSNDARGATIRVDPVTGERAERVQPLVRAQGADLGVRTTVVPGLQTTFTVFLLELDSELLFVGDGGSTEASRPSRRTGIEWTNFYQVNDWITVDLDATLADSEFTDDDPAGTEIPGALRQTVAAGLSLGEGRTVFGGLRWRYFGAAPLIEDDSVRSAASSLLNGRLGYAFVNGLTLELEVFNLLGSEASDVQYYYASRLPGEPAEGIEDIHFHPMEKRSARLVATWRFAGAKP
jgi:TonB dependent receptor/TonB-dependent Receptor Plug Domain